MQLLRLQPRYAALMVEGPFGAPMVIDGPREVERLDRMIAQLDVALRRLSSDQALTEIRGAIHEYPGLREAPGARQTATLIKARKHD